jgi:hypothetical protein
MKKRDLMDLLTIANEHARQRVARAEELLRSNDDLLSRARDAETDRRLAIDHIGKLCNAAHDGTIRDDALAFLKSLLR